MQKRPTKGPKRNLDLTPSRQQRQVKSVRKSTSTTSTTISTPTTTTPKRHFRFSTNSNVARIYYGRKIRSFSTGDSSRNHFKSDHSSHSTNPAHASKIATSLPTLSESAELVQRAKEVEQSNEKMFQTARNYHMPFSAIPNKAHLSKGHHTDRPDPHGTPHIPHPLEQHLQQNPIMPPQPTTTASMSQSQQSQSQPQQPLSKRTFSSNQQRYNNPQQNQQQNQQQQNQPLKQMMMSTLKHIQEDFNTPVLPNVDFVNENDSTTTNQNQNLSQSTTTATSSNTGQTTTRGSNINPNQQAVKCSTPFERSVVSEMKAQISYEMDGSTDFTPQPSTIDDLHVNKTMNNDETDASCPPRRSNMNKNTSTTSSTGSTTTSTGSTTTHPHTATTNAIPPTTAAGSTTDSIHTVQRRSLSTISNKPPHQQQQSTSSIDHSLHYRQTEPLSENGLENYKAGVEFDPNQYTTTKSSTTSPTSSTSTSSSNGNTNKNDNNKTTIATPTGNPKSTTQQHTTTATTTNTNTNNKNNNNNNPITTNKAHIFTNNGLSFNEISHKQYEEQKLAQARERAHEIPTTNQSHSSQTMDPTTTTTTSSRSSPDLLMNYDQIKSTRMNKQYNPKVEREVVCSGIACEDLDVVVAKDRLEKELSSNPVNNDTTTDSTSTNRDIDYSTSSSTQRVTSLPHQMSSSATKSSSTQSSSSPTPSPTTPLHQHRVHHTSPIRSFATMNNNDNQQQPITGKTTDTMKSTVSNAFDVFDNVSNDVLNNPSTKSQINEKLSNMTKFANDAANATQSMVDNTSTRFGRGVEQVGQKVAQSVGSNLRSAANNIETIGQNVNKGIEQAQNVVGTANNVVNKANQVKDITKDALNEVKSTFTDMKSNVGNIIANPIPSSSTSTTSSSAAAPTRTSTSSNNASRISNNDDNMNNKH